MNVFLVDAGKLFSLDASMVSKRVQDLQIALSDLADIPLDKQVSFHFLVSHSVSKYKEKLFLNATNILVYAFPLGCNPLGCITTTGQGPR